MMSEPEIPIEVTEKVTPDSLSPETLLFILKQIGKFDKAHQVIAQKALRSVLLDPAVKGEDLEWKLDHAIRSIRRRFIRSTGTVDDIEERRMKRREEKILKRQKISERISQYLDEEAESGSESTGSSSGASSDAEETVKVEAQPENEVTLDEALDLLE